MTETTPLEARPYRDSLTDLDRLIEERFISARPHPAAPLVIYNYTAKAQFDREWHETTRKCRGLILTADGEMASRPFEKFFNLGEYEIELPPERPEIWRKYDGSLGVLYWLDGRPAIASRGSFTSEQALAATAILEDSYADSLPKLDRAKTYLFEIIYPENRIVVDYGATRELRLLSIVDTLTGEESAPDVSLGFPVAEQVESDAELNELALANADNEEGYVLFWRDRGLRLKVKFADYLRMHRIVTGFSAKRVWEALRDGELEMLGEARAMGTDGFAQWLDGLTHDLTTKYEAIEAAAREAFGRVPLDVDRKSQAAVITQAKAPHVLFKMLDGREYAPLIWEMVHPSRGFETYRKDGE